MRKRAFGLNLLVGLALLVGGCANNSANEQADAGSVEPEKSTTFTSSTDESSGDSTQGGAENPSKLPDVVERALPAVVGISTKKTVELRRRGMPFGRNPLFRDFPFGGGPRQEPPKRERKGMGSGVIVDSNGTVVTNHHVVKEADEIKISLSDRRQKFDAKIAGTDEATDIAVLKMKDPPKDLKSLDFGSSDELRLGETVVAIGNPFGLSGTVTKGIVSAKGRANVGLADYEDFIQTDAAINPGNSGGALVNLEGKLVGINTAILSRSGGYQGIGFAIPSKMVESVMTKLLDSGEVRRGYLGVRIQSVNSDLAEALDLPEETEGVAIADVEDGSPAAEAGLQRHDVVVEFEGEKVETATDLRNRVAQKLPGDKVELVVLRDGDEKTINLELGARQGDASGSGSGRDGILRGLSLSNIDQETQNKFRIPQRLDSGVVVTGIEPGTPAAQTELEPGDVIVEVNRNRVGSVSEFRQAYSEADGTVLLTIYREGMHVLMPLPKGG